MSLRRLLLSTGILATLCFVVSVGLQAGGDHFDERFQPSDNRGRLSEAFLSASFALVAIGMTVGFGALLLRRRRRRR